MASQGTLRRCRCRCFRLLFLCRGTCASCPPWASLRPTSNATADSVRFFSSFNSCGSFGSASRWVTEDSGLISSSGIRLPHSFVVRQSDLAVGNRIASDTSSNNASVPAIGHAGWYCATVWTLRLCTNFTQIHEMRRLLSSYFSHQARCDVQGKKRRTAPQGWRIDSTEPFCSAAKHRFLQWHGDQNGPFWLASSRVSLALRSQGIRNLTISATRQERSRRREELTEGNSRMEHTGEEDLDYYMKSSYALESLKSNQIDSETVQSEEPKEDLLCQLKRNENGKFDNVLVVLGDPRVLAEARDRLSERRWNWTVASNEVEVLHVPKNDKLLQSKDLSYNWIREAAYQLRSGSYSFKPATRLQIARRGRGEARLWVFVRPEDQVIQEAIRGILERIYEHIVSVHDSGFRSGTSVHSALKSVKYGWKRVSWFLQFDVRITDHDNVEKRLFKLLAEQIEDDAFFDALRQMFKLGTVWIDTNADDKPDGSVLSPTLRNIYFHHVDLEISRIKEEIKNCSQLRGSD